MGGPGRWAQPALLLAFLLLLRRITRGKGRVEDLLADQGRRLSRFQRQTVEELAVLVECRDGSTGAHCRNTGFYARLLAEELLRRGLYPEVVDRRYVELVGSLAPLHDVGKLLIPDAVLRKPGPLTAEEFALMRAHAPLGGQVVLRLFADAEPQVREMAWAMAVYHHERWDGEGYPTGRQGREIPLCARIMAVADVFDALSSRRAYKEAIPPDRVFREMAAGSGTRFQPELVELLAELRPRLEAYLRQNK